MKPWLLLAACVLPVLSLACGDEEEAVSDGTVTPMATPVPSATSAASPTGTPTPTAWKTFTNTEYGFSFQYPGDWYLDVHGTHTGTTSDYTAISNYPTRPSPGVTPAPDLFWMEIYVDANPEDLSLEDWVARFHSIPGEPADQVLTSREIVAAGRTGIEQRVIDGGAPTAEAVSEVFFTVTGGVLFTSVPAEDSGSPWLPLYRHVVSSLVFE